MKYLNDRYILDFSCHGQGCCQNKPLFFPAMIDTSFEESLVPTFSPRVGLLHRISLRLELYVYIYEDTFKNTS